MNNFYWECKTKVRFGEGCVQEFLPDFVRQFAIENKNIMIGYGGGSIKRNGAYDDVIAALESIGYRLASASDLTSSDGETADSNNLPNGDCESAVANCSPTGNLIIEFPGIMSNPTLAKMLEGAELARKWDVGLILAVGGGSAMDCCEAIAVQAPYDGDAWQDFWMDGKPMTHTPIPCGVVVTMPATGSEVNGCAVLTNEETKIKCDRWYSEFTPLFALMDPKYTLTMPVRQLRAGTFDILSHIMETYFSWPLEGNPADDTSEGLMRGLIRDFRRAIADPQDYEARSNIMWTASLAENNVIKTGKSKDFQAHNMEHQLSAYTNCNHGEGLAVIHPVYYRHIYKDGLKKFVSFAENVWGLDRSSYDSDDQLALAGVEALADFIREVGLPTSLGELGFGEEEFAMLPEIAESCFISEGAYRPLTHEEILEIYNECR